MVFPGPTNKASNAERMWLDPYGFYRECVAKYGDPFTIALPMGNLVMTANPELIDVIFSADAHQYEVFAPNAQAFIAGERSIFLLNEPMHASRRRLFAPLFGTSKLRVHGPCIVAVARDHVRRHVGGEPFVMQDVTMAISLEVIIRVIFGVTDPDRVAMVASATQSFLHALEPALSFFPALRNPKNRAWVKFCAARDELHRILLEAITQRRKMAPDETMLAQMIPAVDEQGQRLDDDEIRDQLVSFLLAGHETTAISIAWAFYWLARFPEVRDRLYAELDALPAGDDAEALQRLPYLGAVCQETMRLWPIGTEIPRLLRKDLQLGGVVIPAGAAVAACPALTHLREDIYPEPTEFRPERFMSRKYAASEYLPFGGGTRRCLAAGFGIYEMKLVVGTVLRTWELELVHAGPVRAVRRNLTRTLGPEGGVPMRIRGERNGNPSAFEGVGR